jgi:hypothetical protein
MGGQEQEGRRSARWRLGGILASLVSLPFLALFAYRADWSDIGRVLGGIDPGWTAAAVGLLIASVAVRGLRWSLILSPIDRVPLRRLVAFSFIGLGANAVLPARAGELLKIALVQRDSRAGFSSVIATVALERLFDLVALLALLALVLAGLRPSSLEGISVARSLEVVGALFFAATISALVFFAFLVRWPGPTLGLCARICSRLPARLAAPIVRALETFTEGLDALRSIAIVLKSLALSAIVWALNVVTFVAVAAALGLQIGLEGGALVVVAMAFAVALPQAPGYIGPFQVACEAALLLCGVEVSAAKGFAIAAWVVGTVPMVVVALVLGWREGLSLRRLYVPQRDANAERP